MHINWPYLPIYLLNFLRDPRLSLCSLASENLVSWGQELWCDPRECPSHSRQDSRRQLSSPKLVWKRSATLWSGSFFRSKADACVDSFKLRVQRTRLWSLLQGTKDERLCAQPCHRPLLTIVKKQKKWFGHVVRHDMLPKVLQGYMEKQRKALVTNMKEWTGCSLGNLLKRPGGVSSPLLNQIAPLQLVQKNEESQLRKGLDTDRSNNATQMYKNNL